MPICQSTLFRPSTSCTLFVIYLIFQSTLFALSTICPSSPSFSNIPRLPCRPSTPFSLLLAIVFWWENSQFSHSKRVSHPCICDKLAFLLYYFLFDCSTSELSFPPCFSIEEIFSSIQNVIVPAQTSSFCALATVDLQCTAPYWFHWSCCYYIIFHVPYSSIHLILESTSFSGIPFSIYLICQSTPNSSSFSSTLFSHLLYLSLTKYVSLSTLRTPYFHSTMYRPTVEAILSHHKNS